MTSPFEEVTNFQCTIPVKLNCRIRHAGFASYRHLRDNASIRETTVVPDLLRSVADALNKTSEWKTFFRSEKQNSLDDVQLENRELVQKQRRIQRLLSHSTVSVT
jgi:hypothetical protein